MTAEALREALEQMRAGRAPLPLCRFPSFRAWRKAKRPRRR